MHPDPGKTSWNVRFPFRATLIVEKREAEAAKKLLIELSLFDPNRLTGRSREVHFPVIFEDGSRMVELFERMKVSGLKFRIVEGRGKTLPRSRPASPYLKVLEMVGNRVDGDALEMIPDSYEKLGDCLILRLKGPEGEFRRIVAEAYKKATKTRYVMNDVGGVRGEFREPRMEVLVPPEDGEYEVVHREGTARYRFDPRRIMFSSGNISERTAIAEIIRSLPPPRLKGPMNERVHGREVIVDMFAGIGYFTIPTALGLDDGVVITAIEKNPASFRYLVKNIILNGVSDRVIPVLGDCRRVIPCGTADRVIMGYVGGTRNYFGAAVKVSGPEGSIIHFHDTVETEKGPPHLMEILRGIAEDEGRTLELLASRRVKSYAPRIDHVAMDLLLGPAR